MLRDRAGLGEPGLPWVGPRFPPALRSSCSRGHPPGQVGGGQEGPGEEAEGAWRQ